MIAVPEYDDKAFAKKKSEFKIISAKLVEKYIKSFQAITNRVDVSKNFYQYEATCLLIVDFSKKTPKIYNTTAELISDGLLPKDTKIKFEGLEWSSFSKKLIQTYETRFGTGILSWYFSIKKASISSFTESDFNNEISSGVNSGIVNRSIKFFW